MKKSIVLKIFITIAIILTLFVPISYADVPTTVDPGDWEPSELDVNDVNDVIDTAAIVVNIIRAFGIIVSVVVLLIMGIKYMTGSIEEKADYKKNMKPYLIGALIFFGLSQLIAAIIDIVPELFK